jgi:hypothetical protein
VFLESRVYNALGTVQQSKELFPKSTANFLEPGGGGKTKLKFLRKIYICILRKKKVRGCPSESAAKRDTNKKGGCNETSCIDYVINSGYGFRTSSG